MLRAPAVAATAIALAGPRTPDAETKIRREGIAIMMVVDTSGSMEARDLVRGDVSVNRLAVVKDVFRDFVLGEETGAGKGRPDDLIGLIAFAGYADSLCPLTLDHGNLTSMVEDLRIGRDREENRTALGDALALAVERLRRNRSKSKVVLLLTDGVNNAGAIAPEQAAGLAASHGVKVYCIGAGTDGVAPMPMVNRNTGRVTLGRMVVKIDEQVLKTIASKTGGKYFRAVDKESLRRIYAEIDRLERTKVTELRYLQYTEHYAAFVWAALILIAVAGIAEGTIFRRL
ncbi:MAG: VWA domain-containing protein, partial [Planctomycetales bacterium]